LFKSKIVRIFEYQIKTINVMEIKNTKFGQTVLAVKAGTLKAPIVSQGSNNMNYFHYQLSIHKYNLRILSVGMKCKGVTLSQLKKHYALKGRSAKDVCDDFLGKYDKLIEFVTENS